MSLIEAVADKTAGETNNTSSPLAVLATPTPSIQQWLPNRGIVEVNPSSYAGERYVINTMHWDSPVESLDSARIQPMNTTSF